MVKKISNKIKINKLKNYKVNNNTCSCGCGCDVHHEECCTLEYNPQITKKNSTNNNNGYECADKDEEKKLDISSQNEISKEYILKGLGCAGCAAKIEERVQKLNGINEANLAFATSTLKVSGKFEEDNLFAKINDIVTSLEPDVKVLDKDLIDDYEECAILQTHENGHVHSHSHDNLDSHSHGHSNDELKKPKVVRLVLGLILFASAFVVKSVLKGENYTELASTVLFVSSYLFIGFDIISKSISNLSRKEIFDENFLMCVATIAALLVGEYPEAVMVVLLYEIGEYFQGRAVEASRKSISDLMDIRPEYANIQEDNDIKKVSPKQVNVGDIIVVKPGEKVPLDGVIIEGESSVDTSALTGESVPRDVNLGQDITSGFINITGLLKIRVTKSFKDSAVSKILDLVENASSKKAKVEKRITRFARYYTPIVVILAVLTAILPPLFGENQTFHTWIYRAASFLVISCPCALVISVPMGYFAGLGASSRKGILIKGGNYLEALTNIDKVVFDKTGTLTKGNFKVDSIYVEDGIKKEELLQYAAHVESFSNHPIALSVVNEYNEFIDKSMIKEFKEVVGKGAEAIVNGKNIFVGNKNMMDDRKIEVRKVPSTGTIVYVAIDEIFAGFIIIKDQVKDDSKQAVEALKKLGINEVVMLTGDRKATAEEVGNELKIDKVYSELLPHEKVEKVEQIYKDRSNDKGVVFVGDGINDAPVLARADVGVAMGGVGSDAAIEAADVVIMNDEPSKLAQAIKIAKVTKKIVNSNIIFALSTKIVILILAALGIASMWLAVFADVGVALLAVMNSMRILRVK